MNKTLTLLLFVMGSVLAQHIISYQDLQVLSGPASKEVVFSKQTQALSGKTVELQGYMAPPLKPKLDFFVFTQKPQATCPFCSVNATWPTEAVLVLMPKGREADPTLHTQRLRVIGVLELGVKQDERSGFVSAVRIYAKQVKPVD